MSPRRTVTHSPGFWRSVARRWRALGEAMGRVTTPVLMTVFFVFVMTPLALLLRLLGIRLLGPGAVARQHGWVRRETTSDWAARFLQPF